MIYRICALARELTGSRWHPRPQQEVPRGVVRAFLGTPCEFGEDCAYPELGWLCGHRRAR